MPPAKGVAEFFWCRPERPTNLQLRGINFCPGPPKCPNSGAYPNMMAMSSIVLGTPEARVSSLKYMADASFVP